MTSPISLPGINSIKICICVALILHFVSADNPDCNVGNGLLNGVCTACPSGYYSLGAGKNIQVFDKWDSLPDGFTSKCDSGLTSSDCRWSPTESGNSLRSGTDFATGSYLAHHFELVRDGSITYSFRWIAPDAFCIRHVMLDGMTEMNPGKDIQLEEFEITVDLEAGKHNFFFAIQQHSLDLEFDMTTSLCSAYLDRVVIEGVSDYSVGSDIPYGCYECPPGTFSSDSGSSSCTLCGMDTFAQGNSSSSCTSCDPGTSYTRFEGSTACINKTQCNLVEKDMIMISGLSTCQKEVDGTWKQIASSHRESLACLNSPAQQETKTQECAGCEPSKYLTSNGSCEYCPGGQYQHLEGSLLEKCNACSMGTASLNQVSYFYFDGEWDSNWDTGCSGDCGGGIPWVRAGDALKTSHVHGSVYAHFKLNDVLLDSTEYTPKQLSFEYRLQGGEPGQGPAICPLFIYFEFNEHEEASIPVLYNTSDSGDGEWHSASVSLDHYHTNKLSVTWIYHSSSSFSASMVQIRKIIVTGTQTGGASRCISCDSGYFSPTEGSSECKMCSPGHTSPDSSWELGGNYQCEPCMPNYFASGSGESKCLKCGYGTMGNKANASTDCVWPDCSFQASLSGDIKLDKFNLLPLAKTGTDSYRFEQVGSMNMCNRIECGDTQSLACFDNEDFGRMMSIETMSEGLAVNFLYGSSEGCEAGKFRETHVLLHCVPGLGIGQPHFVEYAHGGCPILKIYWDTQYACPLCNGLDDVELIEGQCISGTRRIVRIPKRKCNDYGVSQSSETRPCTEVSISIFTIIVTSATLFCVVVFAAVQWWRKRRTVQRYLTLKGMWRKAQKRKIAKQDEELDELVGPGSNIQEEDEV